MSKFKLYTNFGVYNLDSIPPLINTVVHRLDGAAIIRYDCNGCIDYEAYYVNNKLHRVDGPARIWYNKNKIIEVIYYQNHECHRLDGPANIKYDENGNITEEAYYINGIEYTKDQYYNELLKLKVQSL
jgi:antitoxin component YwqK of YwqJK toxin-antitoxin module